MDMKDRSRLTNNDLRMSLESEQLDTLLAEAIYLERRDIVRAEALAHEVVRRAQRYADTLRTARGLRLLAYFVLLGGETTLAEDYLQQALQRAQSLGDRTLLGECYHTQGRLHQVRGALTEALSSYHEALALRQQLDDDAALANTYNNLGLVYIELDNYDQALHYHSYARELRQQLMDLSGEGQSLNNLGNLEADRKAYKTALRYYQEALVCALQSDDLSLETSVRYNIGYMHCLLGQYHQALPSVRKARQCAKKLGNVNQLLEVRFLMGMLYRFRTHFSLARRYFLSALEQARRLQVGRLEIVILSELGQLYLDWGQPMAAQHYLEDCLYYAQIAGARHQLSTSHERLAQALEQQSNFEGALHHFREFHRLERESFSASVENQRVALRLSLDIARAEQETALHRQRNTELEELARRDSMTGLYNHRAFHETLQSHLKDNHGLALLLLDVDHFKSYNDSFGHPAGDEVLIQIAQILKSHTRESDTLARYGGEEFALILPSASEEDAYEISERLCQAIRQTTFLNRRITLSIGTATATAGISSNQLIAAADSALYQAKHAGRDRWVKAA